MADATANQGNESGKKNGPKSNFPRIPLNKVTSLAEKIYELGEGDPVPRLVVFDRLNKSPDSGPSRMLVTTSNAYGLTTGSYKAERLGITERGRALAQPEDESQRQAAAVKALLDNELFAQFYEKYQSKAIPQEPIAVDYLKQTGNLPEADAKAAYEVFVTNLKDHGFVQEMSGRPTIISQDMMAAKMPEPSQNQEMTPISKNVEMPMPGKAPTQQGQASNNGSQLLTPQFNFNIQVQLPENADAETYDAIFKSMAEHLLKNANK